MFADMRIVQDTSCPHLAALRRAEMMDFFMTTNEKRQFKLNETLTKFHKPHKSYHG
jgi:hypothetical protein